MCVISLDGRGPKIHAPRFEFLDILSDNRRRAESGICASVGREREVDGTAGNSTDDSSFDDTGMLRNDE